MSIPELMTYYVHRSENDI